MNEQPTLRCSSAYTPIYQPQSVSVVMVQRNHE